MLWFLQPGPSAVPVESAVSAESVVALAEPVALVALAELALVEVELAEPVASLGLVPGQLLVLVEPLALAEPLARPVWLEQRLVRPVPALVRWLERSIMFRYSPLRPS